MFSKKKHKQSADELRRAINELETRNDELQAELTRAELTRSELAARLDGAERTLETFDASIRHMGTILDLAEKHAAEIESTARAEANRLREEADDRARNAALEVEALLARRQEALDAITTLLSGLAEVTGDPEEEPIAEPVTQAELEPVAELLALPPQAPAPVTVAELMAMEPNLGF